MTQSMNFNQWGVVGLESPKMKEINGGNMATIKGFTWWGLAVWVASNWSDIKRGARDGFNADHWN